MPKVLAPRFERFGGLADSLTKPDERISEAVRVEIGKTGAGECIPKDGANACSAAPASPEYASSASVPDRPLQSGDFPPAQCVSPGTAGHRCPTEAKYRRLIRSLLALCFVMSDAHYLKSLFTDGCALSPNANLPEPCWWVEVPSGDGRNGLLIRSSRVIVIGRQTGTIHYDGPAGDEG